MHCQFLIHVLKALLFNQNSPKMKLFLQKKSKIFERGGLRPQTPVPPAAGGFAPKPPASGGWSFAPRPPKQPPPPLRISGYAPAGKYNVIKNQTLFCWRPWFKRLAATVPPPLLLYKPLWWSYRFFLLLKVKKTVKTSTVFNGRNFSRACYFILVIAFCASYCLTVFNS